MLARNRKTIDPFVPEVGDPLDEVNRLKTRAIQDREQEIEEMRQRIDPQVYQLETEAWELYQGDPDSAQTKKLIKEAQGVLNPNKLDAFLGKGKGGKGKTMTPDEARALLEKIDGAKQKLNEADILMENVKKAQEALEEQKGVDRSSDLDRMSKLPGIIKTLEIRLIRRRKSLEKKTMKEIQSAFVTPEGAIDENRKKLVEGKEAILRELRAARKELKKLESRYKGFQEEYQGDVQPELVYRSNNELKRFTPVG